MFQNGPNKKRRQPLQPYICVKQCGNSEVFLVVSLKPSQTRAFLSGFVKVGEPKKNIERCFLLFPLLPQNGLLSANKWAHLQEHARNRQDACGRTCDPRRLRGARGFCIPCPPTASQLEVNFVVSAPPQQQHFIAEPQLCIAGAPGLDFGCPASQKIQLQVLLHLLKMGFVETHAWIFLGSEWDSFVTPSGKQAFHRRPSRSLGRNRSRTALRKNKGVTPTRNATMKVEFRFRPGPGSSGLGQFRSAP